MNLLVFNLAMDADDAVHGHTTDWTNALAKRFAEVTVVTMRTGRIAVDANVSVHSLGKEAGVSEPRRLLRFYSLATRITSERRIDACFAHMAPLFTVLFRPLAKRHGIPVLLWYAHASVTRTLRLAHSVADRCVTSTEAGFQIPSEKLFTIGQGIDVGRITPPPGAPANNSRTAVTVGRISPVKRIERMISAVELLRERDRNIALRVFGAPHTDVDAGYLASLRRQVADAGLRDRVSFEGPLPFHRITEAYHSGCIFLNLSETGSIDKAILESMAAGCVPISANASFAVMARDHGLGDLVCENDAASVAECIERTATAPPEHRGRVRHLAREIVVKEHSLTRLSDVIASHLHEMNDQRSPN